MIKTVRVIDGVWSVKEHGKDVGVIGRYESVVGTRYRALDIDGKVLGIRYRTIVDAEAAFAANFGR